MKDMWKSVDGGATWTIVTADTGFNATLTAQRSVVSASGTIIMTGGWIYDEFTNQVWEYTDTTSNACVITSAVIGDIYNIGGISGESTMHIVFTLWDNQGYGRGKTR
jgi:hypothetical protein